jgi:hypothetical protein
MVRLRSKPCRGEDPTGPVSRWEDSFEVAKRRAHAGRPAAGECGVKDQVSRTQPFVCCRWTLRIRFFDDLRSFSGSTAVVPGSATAFLRAVLHLIEYRSPFRSPLKWASAGRTGAWRYPVLRFGNSRLLRHETYSSGLRRPKRQSGGGGHWAGWTRSFDWEGRQLSHCSLLPQSRSMRTVAILVLGTGGGFSAALRC